MSTAHLIKSGIRDNYDRGSVGDWLGKELQPGAALSAVSAYFTIYAYKKLQAQLDTVERLEFLFGEPRFLHDLDPDKTDKKAFQIEDSGIKLANRLTQGAVARECADWIERKAQIRSVRSGALLHGKMYHVRQANGVERAIMGSSNFTVRGLGLDASASNNVELNLVVSDERDREDLKAWFAELWNDPQRVADVKAEVLDYLRQLYANHAPEFIYYKTLYHVFQRFLADQRAGGLLDERTRITETDIWQALFEFQKDGVKGAINKILRHNGCIIADSVGLGKTYEALAIVKYFELLNYRVLVLCPKKLRENWTIYQAQNNSLLNPFVNDRFSYTVLCHTDLSRDGGWSGDIDLATINWGNYDLVVVDESHNFRNNTRGRRDADGNVVSKSRYERLMDDIIRRGVKTRVLLLSATPVNNNLSDLRNQLYFLTEGEDDAFAASLGIPSLRDTLGVAQRQFSEWAERRGERRSSELLERLSAGFFTLLDELTIARSRKHIQRFYADSVTRLGGFPVRERPLPIYAEIDLRGRFMSYDKLNDEISNYRLVLFNPSAYIRPEFQPQYQRSRVAVFTQGQRETFLIGMMKVNFMKRLESSVNSFAITLDRTIAKIEELEARIRRYRELQAGGAELDFDELLPQAEEDEELQDAFEVSKLRIKLAHLDLDRWLADLTRDKQQLEILFNSAQAITVARDAKLARLKELIAAKVRQPTTDKHGRPNRKALVFTAFADTAHYLYDALRDWARAELGVHVALVTGGNHGCATTFGANDFNHILTHFSPVAKQRAKIRTLPQDGEIDLLIATDCISEGQNLQDCDLVINYDIHWNPVRIIQRFGRIDRIGSVNSSVRLVNFWPTDDLNKYINLKNRVEARMALVDITATNEDNLLQPDEIRDVVAADLKYRDRQLLRLRDEVLDLEDFNESVTLSEFTLDDFRADLLRFIESNRRLLAAAPLGLSAVVPPSPMLKQIQSGVIFCLQQQGDAAGSEVVNPLKPYYLVYVRTDGVVRFTFAQPKQILEIYRLLCSGKTAPYEELCNLFDQETCGGASMDCYNDLLQKAVRSIASTFRKRSASHLLSGRSAVLVDQRAQAYETTDFELVTWLVIK